VSAEPVPPRPPKVPAYAWSWLQRSRPVLGEVARRLTGAGPGPGFADELRRRWDDDPFVRGVLLDVVADVAFSGRVPRHRPPGASWDRGLTWWAAVLAGTTPQAFAAPQATTQRPLFPEASPRHEHPPQTFPPARRAGVPGRRPDLGWPARTSGRPWPPPCESCCAPPTATMSRPSRSADFWPTWSRSADRVAWPG